MITLYNEEGPVIARTSDYEFTESDMGESSITATVLLSGVQDFHPDWYVEYNGEKFRLGVRKPTGKKDTSSKKTSYTLVFKSEREDLKRYTFMDFVELGSGNPQPATAKVPLYATLTEFVDRFNLNLQYYLGTRWRMVLPESYVESGNSFSVTFENASLWDVLIQVYEIFGVRWTIQANGEELDIIVGADAVEIEHIFEYGKDNGLVSVERNNELERIITRLRGVGSSTNLPADYFHSGDPDTNSELQSVYFQNLLPSVYRDYVRGYNAGSGTGSWAYNQGVADKQAGKPMSPIDYAKSDNEELWGVSYGAIEANEGIYPTLQGVEKDGLGRIDEVVAVEPVLVDSPEDSTEGTDYRMLGASGSVAARDGSLDTSGIQNCRGESNAVEKYIEATLRITQPYNKCYLLVDVDTNYIPYNSFRPETADSSGAFVVEGTLELFSKSNGSKVASQDCGGSSGCLVLTDLPAGEYRLRYSIKIYAKEDKSPTNNVCNVGYILSGTYTEYTSLGQREGFKETFDIWIKDVWGIERNADESDEDYTYRVWSPLAVSDEMTVMFSDGMLAGEDYEFRIVGASSDSDDLRQVIVNAIHPDTSKSYNGVSSAWRLSVEKSDAELQASGRYLPNSMVQAKAGDHFFFINIKMPYDPYVFDAEERLTAYLDEQLALKDVEYPSFTISPSSIFCKNFAEASKIRAGAKIRVRNAELIGGSYTTLHIQSLTKRYTSGSVNPEWSVTVSDEVVASGNPIETLSGEVAVLNAQAYSSRQAISEAIRQLQSTFLRKDGIFDKSYSPTEFSETVRISDKGIRDAGFVNGELSGKGFAVYTDGDGNRVVEADVIIGRVGARFNEVVINQTTYTGGKQVFSAAGMVVSAVEQIDGGWRCYFDTKNGTVRNMFKVGDGAFCQRFTDAGPLTYWRRVTAIGSDYIDISSTDALAGSAEPGVGDNIAQLGNDTDTSRQAAFMIDEVRDGGGLVTWYDDISGYTLESKDSVMIGRIDGKTWLKVYGSGYIGTRDESQYVKFENGILNIKGAINAESTIGDLGNIGDILSGVSGLEYLKEALPQNTTISGGLILSSTIALGYKDGDTYKVMSGMSGLYDAEQPGGGIAAWYGGDKAEGVAKSLFRFDGTGYLAGGKISWDDAGNVILDKEIKIGDDETLSSILTALNNIDKDYLSKSRGGTVQGDTIFAGKLYVPSTAGAGLFYLVMDASSAVDGETPTAGGGGIDEEELWAILSGNAGTEVVAKQHLPSDTVYSDGLAQTLLPYATQEWTAGQYVKKSGDTMSGNLIVSGAAFYRKMNNDTSNAVSGIGWKKAADDTTIATVGYYNLRKAIYINSHIDEVADLWQDAVGKYTLYVGVNDLTYNTYPILRSDNIGSYALTPSNYTSTLDSRYIRKAGDTVTGLLDINRPGESLVRYLDGGVNKGATGYWGNGIGAYLFSYPANKYLNITDAGSLLFGGNTVWHSGNDGSGSGLDADTVDGLHNGSLSARILLSQGRVAAMTSGAVTAGVQMIEVYNNGYPCSYGNALRIGGSNQGAGELVLGWSGSNGGIERLYYHNKRDMSNTWSDWRTIAFLTDNVASATKLQTARSLWGNSFDGGQNLTGRIWAYNGINIGSLDDYGWFNSSNRISCGLNVARGCNVGSLLVSNAWADSTKVPTNGIYSKGAVVIDGTLTAGGNVIAYSSSSRLVKDILPAVSYSRRLKSLGRVVEYRYNAQLERDRLVHTGLIYENVRDVMPSMCFMHEGYGALNYLDKDYICTIAGAVQENIDDIAYLKNRVASLEMEVERLRRGLAA